MAVRALARHPSRFQPCAAPTGLRAAVGAWARSTPAAARQLHCATPLRAGGGAAKPSIVGCAWPQLRAELFFIIHARPARASPPPRAGHANSVPLGTVATLQQVGEIGFNSSRAMWCIRGTRRAHQAFFEPAIWTAAGASCQTPVQQQTRPRLCASCAGRVWTPAPSCVACPGRTGWTRPRLFFVPEMI